MRYQTRSTTRAPINRDPSARSAKDLQELKRLYHQYLRMGFDEREARFKAHDHHACKR